MRDYEAALTRLINLANEIRASSERVTLMPTRRIDDLNIELVKPIECPVTKGTKHDDGKPALDLLDPYAIEQLGLVMAYGANTYGRFNWCKGIKYSRLIAATLRHMFAFMRGENIDKESGLPHVAHAMANCMMLLGMTQLHPEMDDRK